MSFQCSSSSLCKFPPQAFSELKLFTINFLQYSDLSLLPSHKDSGSSSLELLAYVVKFQLQVWASDLEPRLVPPLDELRTCLGWRPRFSGSDVDEFQVKERRAPRVRLLKFFRCGCSGWSWLLPVLPPHVHDHRRQHRDRDALFSIFCDSKRSPTVFFISIDFILFYFRFVSFRKKLFVRTFGRKIESENLRRESSKCCINCCCRCCCYCCCCCCCRRPSVDAEEFKAYLKWTIHVKTVSPRCWVIFWARNNFSWLSREFIFSREITRCARLR